MNPVICPNCSQTLEDDARYCTHCGAEVAPSDAVTVQSEPATMPITSWDSIHAALREATEGRYDIEATLGQGGMGAVYRAHDRVLDCQVAIKVMLPGAGFDETGVERFRQEARTIAGLRHANIVKVQDLREYRGLHFFVLDYIPGRSLDKIIQQGGPLPISVIRLWLAQVASALDLAHRRGVIHRDIKPANILIDTEGNAVLTDFGIAKLQVNPKWKTATGGFLGTPQYASPEQWKGQSVTAASDQYSLGIVAYAMLAGSPPFDGDAISDLLLAHTGKAPDPVGNLRPDCPPDLATVVHRMLEKEPADRWPGMRDLMSALGPVAPPDDPVWSQAAKLAGGEMTAVDSEAETWVTPPPEGGPPESLSTRIALWVKPRRKRLAVGGVTFGAVLALLVAWPVGERAGITLIPADSAPRQDSTQPVGGRDDEVPTEPVAQAAEVRLDLAQTSLEVGDTIRATVTLLDVEDRAIGTASAPAFLTEDERVARLVGGQLIAVGPGATRVSVRTNGLEAEAQVSVAAVVPVFSSISAGAEHTCGVTADGTVYCWGGNGGGRVATDLGERQLVPFPWRSGFGAVSAGGEHTCALGRSGSVACWGRLVTPSGRYSSLTSGFGHACGITRARTAACWGANDRGQLGDGTTVSRTGGVQLQDDPGFEMLAAGDAHTCGLLEGRVYCWGNDEWGQTGTGVFEGSYVTQPTEVEGDHGYLTYVTAGTHHTCALTRAGAALCWGANDYGQLGDGSRQQRLAPRPVRAPMGGRQTLAFQMLSAGESHTCGVARTGRVFCWGDNRFGQLGDGSTTQRVVPVPVDIDESIEVVSVGWQHTCAVGESGVTYCWGANNHGQLGDGTLEHRSLPVTPGCLRAN
jgi:alpha-tubulin suppressor-like RCC1 family protein